MLTLAMMAGLAIGVDSATGTSDLTAVGKRVADFTLKDFHGKDHAFAEASKDKVVVLAFLGTECPLAKLYASRLSEMAKDYAAKGVVFIGIDANRQDNVTEMAAFARVHGLNFPFLKDLGNTVADQIGAQRTPEVYVVDKEKVIRYAGRIDDQYGLSTSSGYARPKVTRKDLAIAIDEVLAGKPVSTQVTKAPGCLIGRARPVKEGATVSYSKDIAPLLAKYCVECHRPGEIGPFALTNYSEVAGWADMIQEVIGEQRMPPWHADPRYGKFTNEKRLTDEEKRLIATWVAAGAPEGDPKDLPPAKSYVDGWSIPEPDQVIWITDEPVKVPAEGVVEYKYYTVDPGFKEDKWVRLADCRVGNRAVVHHIIAFVQEPGTNAKFNGNEPVNAWLLHGYAPGMPALRLPDDTAMFIPAGSKIVFQMHYTPNGTASEDKSCLGLVFADPKTVKRNARTANAINPYLRIPPGADNHPVEAQHRFTRDAAILSFMPHMHLRGKAFRYEVVYPDGAREVLLDVPHYDFNWQNMYYLAEPKHIPAGSKLLCFARYDNSENNLANPNPKEMVRWGDQTWEEMMIGWFNQTTDVETPAPPSPESRTMRFLASAEKEMDKVKQRVDRGAKRATVSPITFSIFGRGVMQSLPQIDRMCVAVQDGDKIVVKYVQQSPALQLSLGTVGETFAANSSALASIAGGKEPVVVNRLASRDEADMKRFASRLGSSLHVPITVDGKPATINFFSREPDAFPEPVSKLLIDAARQIAPN